MSTLKGGSEAQTLIKMPTLAKPIISRKSFKRGEVDVSLPFGRNKNRKKMESKNAKVDFDLWMVPCPRISPVFRNSWQ